MKPIDLYLQQLRSLPQPEAGWFAVALTTYRAGRDDASRREISGRFLDQTLAEAVDYCRHQSGIDLLDAVQEANAALWKAIESFQGETLSDFQGSLHQQVQMRLYQTLPSTGLA